MPKDFVPDSENTSPSSLNLPQSQRSPKNVFFNSCNPVVKSLEPLFQENGVLPLKDLEHLEEQKGLAPRYLLEGHRPNDDSLIKSRKLDDDLSAKTLMTQFLLAGLYKKILGNQAPNIQLVSVSSNVDGKSMPYLQYTFSKQVESISPILSEACKTNNYSIFGDIKGIPQVIASCLLLGEKDADTYKLGTFKSTAYNPQRQPCIEHTAVKTNHTCSGLFLHDEKKLRSTLLPMLALDEPANILKNNSAQKKYISCNLTELQHALSEMITVSDAKITSLINARVEKLKKYYLNNCPKLSNFEKEYYVKMVTLKAKSLIDGVIRQKNIIRDELLKSLEVIAMIAQAHPHCMAGDWVFINYLGSNVAPIENLISKASELSENPRDLHRLKEITEFFYRKTIQPFDMIEPKVEMLNQLEASKDWAKLYVFEKTPLLPTIKQAQQLKSLKEAIGLKEQSLLNPEMGIDLDFTAHAIKAKQTIEREKMEWLIENHPSETFNLSDSQLQLKADILEKNLPLHERYQKFLKERGLIEFLKSNVEEAIEILFYPTDCVSTQAVKKAMLGILDQFPCLKERYYPLGTFRTIQEDFLKMPPAELTKVLHSPELDKQDRIRIQNIMESPRTRENHMELQAKQLEAQIQMEREHLLRFMGSYPDKVIKLLKSPSLDPQDRLRMEAIIRSPSTFKERKMSIRIKKFELQTYSIERLVDLYCKPETDEITKQLIFSLHPNEKIIKDLAIQAWKKSAINATSKQIYDKINYLRRSWTDELDIAENLLMSFAMMDKEMETYISRKYEEYQETLEDKKVKLR